MLRMMRQAVKISRRRMIGSPSLAALIFIWTISSAMTPRPAKSSALDFGPADDFLLTVFKPVDALLSRENALNYRDCELKRSATVIDKSHGLYQAVLVMKYKGKDIKTVQDKIGEMSLKNLAAWYGFGIYPLLGDENDKQVLMTGYSGGAHCCWSYWVYALRPEPVEIYSSKKWGLGNEMRYGDPDHDGAVEISQSVMAFDYFDRCCHAASPMPWIILKYDKALGEYLPANELFANEILRDTDRSIADLNRVSMERDDSGGFFLGAVLSIVLPHIYAGRETEGWRIFDRVYRLQDKEEMKSKIKAKLKDNTIYGYLYGGGNR